MIESWRTLGRLTATRKPRHLGKEVGIGLMVGVLLGGGTALHAEWAFWVLLLSFTSVQAVALTENEVFCDFRDFRRLGFREPSLGYRIGYVVHYVARDLHVANLVAGLVASTIMVVAGRPWFALLLWVLALANLALVPSHVHLAFKLAERSKLFYIAALFVAVLALAVPLGLGHRVAHVPMLVPLVVALTLVHVVVVDRVAVNLRGTGLSSFGGRRWFAWLKPLSPHLFKDMVMFNGLALQSLFLGGSLFALLIVGSPPGSVAALILLTLCHDNMFLARKDRAYRIVSEDTLFLEGRLPRDRGRLRRSKMVALLVDVPVTMALATVLLVAFGAFRLDHLALMLLVTLTGFVVDAPRPHLGGRPGVWLRSVVNYLTIIVFFVVVTYEQPLVLVVIQCAVVGAVYLPTFVSTHLPRDQVSGTVTSSVASSPPSPPRPEQVLTGVAV